MFRYLLISLLLLTGWGWAKPTGLVSSPPDYLLDKQLEGEDMFDIAKPVFSPDQRYLAAMLHSSRVITVWDTQSGKPLAQIAESVHGLDALDGLEFSPDGKQLLLLRKDFPLRYLDWQTAQVVREVPLQADPKKILSYAFSPGQDRLAVGTYNGISLWDLKAGKKVREYLPGKAISGLDMFVGKDAQGRPLRLLSYGRAVLPPDTSWKDVVGVLNLDSGQATPLLNDLPADKKVEGAQAHFFSDFSGDGGQILASYSLFPPKVKAGALLIDTGSGGTLAQHNLGQPAIKFVPSYLGKPFYGYVIASADMSRSGEPYACSTQFLVPVSEPSPSLKVIDSIGQDRLATYALRISPQQNLAAIVVRKDASDSAKIYLYRIVPKKP